MRRILKSGVAPSAWFVVIWKPKNNLSLIHIYGIIDPLIGMNYLVSVFAATVIGGIGNPFGAVVGALIIGLVEETSALAVSTTYCQGISFVVLVLVLLMRPQGLFGSVRIRR